MRILVINIQDKEYMIQMDSPQGSIQISYLLLYKLKGEDIVIRRLVLIFAGNGACSRMSLNVPHPFFTVP